MSTTKELQEADAYLALNALSKSIEQCNNHFDKDKKAVEIYMNTTIKNKTKLFSSLKERFDYLIKNNYYDESIINSYKFEEIEQLYNIANEYNHTFPNFMGALKFYNSYCLKSNDGSLYLENYTDRVIMNSLFLGNGIFDDAKNILIQIMTGRYQPATPTFLNAGKAHRGEYISCYLLRAEDNMESIAKIVSTSLQLSKRGGGVAICLTNLREFGAPIKNIENQSTGVIPVMKILEDTFSYANQLGQRQGAGCVYLNVHHPDIISFLDTKRENADEKIRIKSLSLGVVIPDITFTLAKNNEDMALFSPYDVEKVYKKPFSDISITKEYYNMLKNENIKKTFINARKLFQIIAELHFESGYPYILFDDTVNEKNPHDKIGRIIMSNLCSEIVQVNTPSTYNEDMTFNTIGNDICCNLGSLNIDKMMKSGNEFKDAIYYSVKSLHNVSKNSNLDCAPSIKKGNSQNHAIGLGAMNLHGFLSTHHIYYNSPEAVDFTNIFFYTVCFYAFSASNKISIENNEIFANFDKSKYADGSYFDKYINCEDKTWTPKTEKIKQIFENYNISIPTRNDWINLVESIKKFGLANAHLLAVAPTGSISYLSSCTPSLQPVVSPVEVRKEGKLGRIYVPAYNIDKENIKYYQQGAYEIGANPIIDIVAAAQQHVDQAISLTLFMKDTATTRDLNKAYIYAFKNKCASIYYVRVRQEVLEGSENYTCESCVI